MAVFDDIKLGLEQAIEYEKGNLKAKKTTMAVLPLESFTSAEIKEIRVGAGMTQALFAKYFFFLLAEERDLSDLIQIDLKRSRHFRCHLLLFLIHAFAFLQFFNDLTVSVRCQETFQIRDLLSQITAHIRISHSQSVFQTFDDHDLRMDVILFRDRRFC